jgi:hypothetical protein
MGNRPRWGLSLDWNPSCGGGLTNNLAASPVKRLNFEKPNLEVGEPMTGT